MKFLYRKELKDNEGLFAIIEIAKSNDWIYLDWIGYQDESRIKTGMNHLIDLFEKYNRQKLLNNNNNHHGAYPPVIYEWIEAEWLPHAQDKGLKYTATVLSPKVFSRISAQHMESKFKSDFYKNFEDIDDAVNWLQSIHNP